MDNNARGRCFDKERSELVYLPPKNSRAPPSRLLNLPRELRDMIYDALWRRTPTLWKVPYQKTRFRIEYDNIKKPYSRLHKLPRWLLTNKLILHEGLEQLRSKAVWIFGSDSKVESNSFSQIPSTLLFSSMPRVTLKLSHLSKVLRYGYIRRIEEDPRIVKDLETVLTLLYKSRITKSLRVRFRFERDCFPGENPQSFNLTFLDYVKDLGLERLEFELLDGPAQFVDDQVPSSITAESVRAAVHKEVTRIANHVIGGDMESSMSLVWSEVNSKKREITRFTFTSKFALSKYSFD